MSLDVGFVFTIWLLAAAISLCIQLYLTNRWKPALMRRRIISSILLAVLGTVVFAAFIAAGTYVVFGLLYHPDVGTDGAGMGMAFLVFVYPMLLVIASLPILLVFNYVHLRILSKRALDV
jgi:hypothetical protein